MCKNGGNIAFFHVLFTFFGDEVSVTFFSKVEFLHISLLLLLFLYFDALHCSRRLFICCSFVHLLSDSVNQRLNRTAILSNFAQTVISLIAGRKFNKTDLLGSATRN